MKHIEVHLIWFLMFLVNQKKNKATDKADIVYDYNTGLELSIDFPGLIYFCICPSYN